jgi:hypothetical protein
MPFVLDVSSANTKLLRLYQTFVREPEPKYALLLLVYVYRAATCLVERTSSNVSWKKKISCWRKLAILLLFFFHLCIGEGEKDLTVGCRNSVWRGALVWVRNFWDANGAKYPQKHAKLLLCSGHFVRTWFPEHSSHTHNTFFFLSLHADLIHDEESSQNLNCVQKYTTPEHNPRYDEPRCWI